MPSTMQVSFTGGELSPSLQARVDLARYFTSATKLKNFMVHQHGGISNRPGTQFVTEVKTSAKKTRLIPFQFSVVQNYILEFGDSYIRVIKDGGIVLDGASAVEITSPYGEDDLADIKYTQSADTLYLTHPSYAPRKLTRSSHTAWTISTLSFSPGISAPSSFSASGSGYKFKISAVSETGEESVPSSYTTAADSGSSTFSWSAVSDADYYKLYKERGGIYGWVSNLEGTSWTATEDDLAVEPDMEHTTIKNTTPFGSAGNYPGVCAFYEQRLIFGRTNNKPQTFWGSRIGFYENFSKSTPLRDDDSYEFTLSSEQVNEIKWMAALNDLIIGTTGKEFKVTGGSGNTITPTNVQAKPQSANGSQGLVPIVSGDRVLYVQYGGKIMRDMGYSLERDGYPGDDLTIFANHLFINNDVIDWAYQKLPDSIIWCVLKDGTMAAVTYNREQQVLGWTRHETTGTIESIAAIPTTEGRTEVYMIVKREVDEADVRYVERFRERFIDDDFSPESAYFVDCGLTYDSTAATTISGLSHLEGCEVAVLADGNVVSGLTVDTGAITLPQAAEVVHVGLPFTAEFESLDIEMQTESGTLQDRKRVVHTVIVSLENTRSFWSGPNEDEIDEVIFREGGAGIGEAVPLYTGDKEINIRPGNVRQGRVYIVNPDPLPITINAIIPRLTYGNE